MSFFSSLSNFANDGETAREVGERALRIMWEESEKQFPSGRIFIEFLKEIDSANKLLVNTVGNSIQIAESSENQVKNAMIKAAKVAQGRIPANTQSFINVLNYSHQEFDLSDFIDVSEKALTDLNKISSEGARLIDKGLNTAMIWQIGGAVIALAVLGQVFLKAKR